MLVQKNGFIIIIYYSNDQKKFDYSNGSKFCHMSPRYFCWAISRHSHLVISCAIHFQTVECPLSGPSQCRAVASNTNVHPTVSSDPSSNHKLSYSPNELVSATRNCWRFGCPCLKKDCYSALDAIFLYHIMATAQQSDWSTAETAHHPNFNHMLYCC